MAWEMEVLLHRSFALLLPGTQGVGLESLYILIFQFGFHGKFGKNRFGAEVCIKHKIEILISQG